MVTFARQFDRLGQADELWARYGDHAATLDEYPVAMPTGVWQAEATSASPPLLSEDSRLGKFFLGARLYRLAGHVSRGGRLGFDGASLGFVSAFSIEP